MIIQMSLPMKYIGYGLIVILILSLQISCSGVKTYSNTLQNNFYVKTKVNTGSALTSTVTAFDVHRINARCELDYMGRIYLDDPLVKVGVPVDEMIYLDFIFVSKAFMSTTSSVVRYDTLLMPRSGYSYDTEVSYINGIYNVVIRETRTGSSIINTIERKSLNSCKSK